MKTTADQHAGFTITELLVVITVIGILALLVLNGFGNALRDARNAQTFNAVESYRKAWVTYGQLNHTILPTSGSGEYCFGNTYPSGKCWAVGQAGYEAYDDPTVDTALKSVMGSTLPMPGIPPGSYPGPGHGVGMILWNGQIRGADIDGQPWKYFLAYAIEGTNTRCSGGQTLYYTGYPHFTKTPNNALGQTFVAGYTPPGGVAIPEPLCFTTLNDPSDF